MDWISANGGSVGALLAVAGLVIVVGVGFVLVVGIVVCVGVADVITGQPIPKPPKRTKGDGQ